MNILIIEDEIEIADGICTILEKDGYNAFAVYDGVSGLDEMMSGIYDLVLLDIMLPKMSGIEIIKTARNDGFNKPVIMLTALSEMNDKISGLDSGADDYITKPFNAGELLARIRARLRNVNETMNNTLTFADIRLEQSSQKLYGAEKSVRLAKKEFQMLEYLIMNKGQILTRESIILRIWGYDEDTEYNQVDVYISFVRKKLKFVNSTVKISASKGVGYYLEAGV